MIDKQLIGSDNVSIENEIKTILIPMVINKDKALFDNIDDLYEVRGLIKDIKPDIDHEVLGKYISDILKFYHEDHAEWLINRKTNDTMGHVLELLIHDAEHNIRGKLILCEQWIINRFPGAMNERMAIL